MNCYFSNIFNMFMICYYTTHAYHLILLKSMMEVFFFYSFFSHSHNVLHISYKL